MLKFFLKRLTRRFAQRYNYDAGYMEHFIDVNPGAFFKFSRVLGVSAHRAGIPAEPWFAAKIRTVLGEDCGPCTQLAVNMALEAGVPPAHIEAIVSRNLTALPKETVLVIDFTECVLAHDPAADDLRDEIVALWGDDAIVSLAMVISSTRIYPTLKYVLGFGKACSRIDIEEHSVPAVRASSREALA